MKVRNRALTFALTAALLYTGAALGASAQSRAKGNTPAGQSGPKKTTARPDEQAAPKKASRGRKSNGQD